MNPSQEELWRWKRAAESSHVVPVGVKEADSGVEPLRDVSTEGLPAGEVVPAPRRRDVLERADVRRPTEDEDSSSRLSLLEGFLAVKGEKKTEKSVRARREKSERDEDQPDLSDELAVDDRSNETDWLRTRN